MTTLSFSSLNISKELLASIKSLDYKEMTPIQRQSLPIILQGKDLLAQAKTGSGKTAAFAIGILNQIEITRYETQSLVLCPTRELADQVAKEIRRLARQIANTKILILCGGKPMGPQLASLEHPPHIVVGTPGRILKHLEKSSLKIDNIKSVVLDEADRMLDMGFHQDIMEIVSYMPTKRQTLLFSATYPEEIKSISNAIQHEPSDIRLETLHDSNIIKQVFYKVKKGERTKALEAILYHYKPESTVIFCNRKQQSQELANALWQKGYHALALHGDLEQKDRDQVLVQFSNHSSSILVATDVAARGLDIKDLHAVINFELSPDPEIYVHRIGRTGRAGNKGLAISLLMDSEQPKLKLIEEFQETSAIIDNISTLRSPPDTPENKLKLHPTMVTLSINAGRKSKIRAGDILGALTGNTNLDGKQIGKIDIFDMISYVAIERPIAKQALKILTEGKIKGRKCRVRKLR